MNFYGATVVDVHASFTSILSSAAIVDAIRLVITVTFQWVWVGSIGEKRREKGRVGKGGREERKKGRRERGGGRRERKQEEVRYDNL